MKTRIVALVAMMLLAVSSFCFASVTGGVIGNIRNTMDGQKIIIYTQEGYSVAEVLEYPVDCPLETSDIIEAVNGYTTDVGRLRIRDLHNGSSRIIIDIVATHLLEQDAMRWLENGGRF